jgi:hypothetical protein
MTDTEDVRVDEVKQTGSVVFPPWIKAIIGFSVALVIAVFSTIGWLDSNYAKRAELDTVKSSLTSMQLDLKTLLANQPDISNQVKLVDAKHDATIGALTRIERSQDKLERRIDDIFSKVSEKL